MAAAVQRPTVKQLIKRRAAAATDEEGIFKSSLRDCVATAVFVFISSIFSQLSGKLEDTLGMPPTIAGLSILVAALIGLDQFNSFLGKDVLNNPSNNVAFATAGRGYLSVHLARIVAQVLGGLAGAYLAIQYIPKAWQTQFGALSQGVKPGVSLSAGVACEAALAFLLNLVILYSLSTKRKVLGALAPLIVTIVLVIAGSELTGPSMNPAHAFSWYYFLEGHDRFQHLAVFWAAPLGGALAAGLTWNALTAPAGRSRRSRAPAKADGRAAKKEQ